MNKTRTETPWDSIVLPEGDIYSIKNVGRNYSQNFFWAVDHEGKCIFQLLGEGLEDTSKKSPKMNDITVISGHIGGNSHLSFRLENTENKDIFYSLCLSLLNASEDIEEDDYEKLAALILLHLARWKAVFKNTRSGLSNEKQIGLFGELSLLKDIYYKNLEEGLAVGCWVGALGHEQDFEYGNSICEVKTTTSTSDASVKISNVEQLDPTSGDLTLVYQALSKVEDNALYSNTLDGLVRDIIELLDTSPFAHANFIGLLEAYGYETGVSRYDEQYYIMTKRRYFSVEKNFPRIVRPLPNGISNLSYSLSIQQCLDYEVDEDIGVKRILNKDHSSVSNFLNIEDLIKMDESETLEFKSSVRYCTNSNKEIPHLESNIVKAIAGFSNANGGILIIGIDDKKKILGLKNDLSLKYFSNIDTLTNKLTILLKDNFGITHTSNKIKISIHRVDEKVLCMIKVKRADNPVFVKVKGAQQQVLYVRVNSITNPLSAVEFPEFLKNWEVRK